MNNIHIKCFYGLLRQDINKTLTKHKIKHFTDSKEKSVLKTFYEFAYSENSSFSLWTNAYTSDTFLPASLVSSTKVNFSFLTKITNE